MFVVQVATKLRNDNRLARCDFGQSLVVLTQLESETFWPVPGARGRWTVNTKRDPIAIILAGKIGFERIPFLLRLIEPVHVPDPLQVVGTFVAYQVNDVAVSGNILRRPSPGSAIPGAVPTEPLPVWFRPPFHQQRCSEISRATCPTTEIGIKFARDNFIQRKNFLGVILINIRTQHHAQKTNFPELTNRRTNLFRKVS